MAFNGLVAAAKSLLDRVGGGPALQTLSLEAPESKGIGDIAFDAVSAAWYARNGYGNLYALLSGGLPAWSGEHVSLQTALNHATVWACTSLISGTVGMLPVNMIRKQGADTVVADTHPMYSALHNAPNAETGAMEFKEALTAHVLLEGNAFARVIRRSGATATAIGLDLILPEHIAMDREKNTKTKRIVYTVKTSAGEVGKTFTIVPGKPQDIFHLRGLGRDGLRGYSVLTMGRQSIGTAIAVERNVGRFYANGGRVPYILNRDKAFSKTEDFDKFRFDWENTYSEPGRAPILEPGMKYQQIGFSLADSQMLEMRAYTVSEICRWFSCSPHLAGDLSKATFSNIENLFLEFKIITLDRFLRRWEQALWRCVLTPEEQHQNYHFRFNANALLRGDFATRVKGFSTMIQNGITSVNEVRALEDMNSIPNGDKHYIQVNMQELGKELPNDPNNVRVTANEEELLDTES